jgi:carbonic anhydrase/acetyltransferase-like protein (isoleucine patch superfamily)
MTLYQVGELVPTVAADAFVAPNASVIGQVVLAARSSVWFGAILRGDNEPIHIGEGSNVQESAVLHTDPGFPLRVAANVTIGHQVMLHGCTIGEGSLVGIQSVVLNGAVVGKSCLIGAGALLTERKVFPDRTLILGSPAKVIRDLTDEEVAKLALSAEGYVRRAALYCASLKAL